MNIFSRPLIPAAVLWFLAATALSAQEWPRFRGPNGTGISDAKTIPVDWSGNVLNWKIKLAGTGHGSPVVWGDRLFVVSANIENNKWLLECIDTDSGKQQWIEAFDFAGSRWRPFDKYVLHTPAADSDHVYVLLAAPLRLLLVAMTHKGKLAWKLDLGSEASHRGGGVNPIVYDGKVIVSSERRRGGFILAVDCKTGKTVWREGQEIKKPQHCMYPTYSAPVVMQPKDSEGKLLVFHSKSYGLSVIDPDTGGIYWKAELRRYHTPVSDPVISDGKLITIDSGGLRALEPFHPEPLSYEYKDARRSMNATPILVDGALYIFESRKPTVRCIEAKTGKEFWTKSMESKGFYGSPVCVNGIIYCVDTAGNVVIFKASKSEPEEVHLYPLREMSYATPAVSGGRMFLRTKTQLFSVGGR